MSFDFDAACGSRLDEIIQKYPQPQSAVMPALYMVQELRGEIDDEAIEWISKKVGLSQVHVLELVTFYTMYHRRRVGKYHVQVCRTLSCALCGSRKLMEYLHERLHLTPGQVSEDGKWSYEAVECLGSCGSAPMCEINDRYFENLTPEKLGEIMDKIERENPDLSFSTLRDAIGDGLAEYPKSSVR